MIAALLEKLADRRERQERGEAELLAYINELKDETPLYDALYAEASPLVQAILRAHKTSAGANNRDAGSGSPKASVPADPIAADLPGVAAATPTPGGSVQ